MRVGTYIALGFGETMKNTNLIFWAANSSENGHFSTYFSRGHSMPLECPDVLSCYKNSVEPVYEDSDFVDFITSRPLDCEIEDSFVIKTDQITPMISAWNPKNSNMSFHGIDRE